MTKQIKSAIFGMMCVGLLLSACSSEENEPSAMQKQKSYQLSQIDNSGVGGTVTFMERDDSTTVVTIQLTGTKAGDTHPAHIHGGQASDGGPIVLDLNAVDGASGKSETIVTRFNDGTPVTYDELIGYDGHVNVHKSAAELAVIIAQGGIGSNAGGTPSPDTNGNGDTSGDDGYDYGNGYDYGD